MKAHSQKAAVRMSGIFIYFRDNATCGDRLSADKKVNVLTPENSVFTAFSGVNLFYDGG